MAGLTSVVIPINCVLVILSIAAISCRLGQRIFRVGSFGWHDALITLAAICAVIFSVLQMVTTLYGAGEPIADVPMQKLEPLIKLVVVSRVFYFVCNWSVKHSLLLFYAELTIDKWPRRSIYFMHAVAIAFGVTCICATLFHCIPLHALWDPNVPGQCINLDSFNYFNSCFMLATDLVLYAMPLVFTWRIQLRRPQRIGVIVLFALGALVLAASGARIYSVDAQAKHPDFTYQVAITMLCAVTENHLAIIVACAPSIKVILLLAFSGLGSKFDKLVSNSVRSGTVMYDGENKLITKEWDRIDIRQIASQTTSNQSEKSWETRTGRWWRAPSSWNVSIAR